MADPRFYDRLGPLTVKEIAALSSAAISDSATGETQIDTVAPLTEARAGAISYLDGTDVPETLSGGVVLVRPGLAGQVAGAGGIALEHAAPRAAFAVIANALFRPRECFQDAAVHPDAIVHADARLAPGAVIGAGAEIGAGCQIQPNAVIGPGCRIGARTTVGANASIRCADIGADCNILAGAVIGEAGFGVAVSEAGIVDIPHLGSVLIGEQVTIGAHTAVDRGVFGATRIGDACKLDNLCHIAHNTQVGRNVILPGQSGTAGSVVIGDNVMAGGRVGVYDHVTIGEGARIGAASVVSRDIPPGQTWAGSPARPIREHMRQVAALNRMIKTKKKSEKGG